MGGTISGIASLVYNRASEAVSIKGLSCSSPQGAERDIMCEGGGASPTSKFPHLAHSRCGLLIVYERVREQVTNNRTIN